ncbi:MAG: hypothetical protein ACD_75C02641G0004 [uncultured bacterium]|nr:MAG: hypothetical protein ACD_75C02641G0004 [uncultured bacterium]
MIKGKTVHLIGCGVLSLDIKRIATNLSLQLKTTFLPAGLHEKPIELHSRLQEAIDIAGKDEECSRIVVGYGICGRGTVGIQATCVPLVFPRVHDCVALFLGSDQAYKKEFNKCPGTFYLTAGWQHAKGNQGKHKDKTIWIGSESIGCQALREQYGAQGAERIIDFFSSWQKNYKRAVFIDTGHDNSEKYSRKTRAMADEYHWQYEEIPGNDNLMRRLLTEEQSTEDILVVPPGHCTIYSAFKDQLDFAPIAGTLDSCSIASPNVAKYEENLPDDKRSVTKSSIRYGLGIDAGGTYTDAVVYDFQEKKIQCKSKALTTKWDFSVGINNALAELDQDTLSLVELVSVSTTLATNAIVEGQGQKTGLLFMNNAALTSGDIIGHSPARKIKGYINISGQELLPIDEEEVRRAVREMVDQEGVTAFAVSGFGGAVNPAHELRIKEIIEQETGLIACCGHELSDLLDFSVRAQTAVLNARIIPLIIRFFREIDAILKQRSIAAPVMVVKGDGTLMSVAMARERPVETILSGPAASVAGAKMLTGLRDALVVDMGGTTSDIAEIRNNSVAVCARGARVGGFVTHVRALDMRTAGLGGDSLIRWKKGELSIGPRRVTPLVLAANLDRSGILRAVSRFDQNSWSHLEQVILFATQGTDYCLQPTTRELKIIELLRNHPHTPEELAAALGVVSSTFLPTERLEEWGMIQRCGLTPTDLLHARGDYQKWDPGPAQRLLEILSLVFKKPIVELVEELLEKVKKSLALELLQHLIFDHERQSGGSEKNGSDEARMTSSTAQHLIDCMLEPSLNSRYGIRADFHIPVVGVGAPIAFFLPGVEKNFNTRVIVPPDGDVANALGAITSHIAIRQKLVISPDGTGGMVVEGVAGNHTFADLQTAQTWAVQYLTQNVRSQAIKAGTSVRDVVIAIDDRIVNTAQGIPLFIERAISATLTGNPDLVEQGN